MTLKPFVTFAVTTFKVVVPIVVAEILEAVKPFKTFTPESDAKPVTVNEEFTVRPPP